MAISLGDKRRELLARTIADFTKAIFAVAVASEFFKTFEPWRRTLLGVMVFLGVIAALAVQPEKGDS